MKRLLIPLLFSVAFLACRHEAAAPPPAEFTQWRAKRLANLTKENGWLTLVGLDWLKEGPNEVTLPSRPAATIQATLDHGKVTLAPSPSLTIEGKRVDAPVQLRDDADPKGPTIVALGTIRFYAIKRNDRYGFRVRDLASDARTKFAGLDYFPYDPKYRVEAKWVPYNPPRAIPITNVLGMTSNETSPGRLVFTIDGKEYGVEPILEQGESDLFIIFRDETAGKETYGAARYLYASPPGPDGKVVVDFNKAYNPPCAFTSFATCPLPPAQNKLPVRITAGEKKYAGGHA
ncbi:MAG TPA: DUF1684 domain-containing protein [Thermoanaerobaculia bacterium]|jgi:uncharacterized protein (DUF1684 family)|nr:DUF1684 domain-containing protein [Thermoanaerobaculia bacterium]